MELHAPSHWHCIDFISDLHLQAEQMETFQAWVHYLEHTAADAVFILGDLFEVWVGDDVIASRTGFEKDCVQALHAASHRRPIYIMQGNRDFLMGSRLMDACASTLLDDPTVLTFAHQRWLLTHGDALCLDDIAYMQFRALVRGSQWQHEFLKKPLSERLAMARALRTQSEALKRANTIYADVDTTAANALLSELHADHMIHGHTHRPGKHPLDGGKERIVLSDWDLNAHPPRFEVLRLTRPSGPDHRGAQITRLSPAMAHLIEARPQD